MTEKVQKKTNSIKNYIIGIATLFVIASIAYSTVVIALGTQGLIPKILIVPQAIYAFVILIKRFTK